MRPPDFDNGRISALAAGLTIGGHAAVLFAALLLGGRGAESVVVRNVVGVTLVSGGAPGQGDATGAAASPMRPSRPASPAPAGADTETAGERLDWLIAPSTTPSTAKPTTDRSATPERPMAIDTATLAPSRTGGGTGSSRAGQGLEPGEGAAGVDLYAGASLPDVGQRTAGPVGDLWRQVSACWRPAAPRRIALLVVLTADGRLTDAPQAVRRNGAAADPQILLAERAAVRALQACAPYPGLGGRQWRVEFP